MEPKSWIPQKTSTVAFLVFQHKDQRKERHLTEKDNGGDGEEKLWQCRCRPDWFRWNGTLPDPACSVSNTACSLLLALLLAVSNAACSVFFAACYLLLMLLVPRLCLTTFSAFSTILAWLGTRASAGQVNPNYSLNVVRWTHPSWDSYVSRHRRLYGCVLLIIAFCVVILSELKETENIWNFPELKIQSQFSSFWWLYQQLLRCSRWMRIPISKFNCFNGKVLVLDL